MKLNNNYELIWTKQIGIPLLDEINVPSDLRNLLGSEIRTEELTDEEAPEDYLMN